MDTNVDTSEMLEAILSSIDEGIHVVDAQGITIYYNKVIAELDGLSKKEVIGKHVLEVFPSLDDHSSTLLRVIKTGEHILHKPQSYTNIKGKQVETVNTTLPIHVRGRLVGAVEVAKDISTIKELSEKLLDLQAKIYDRQKKKEQEKSDATTFFIDDFITQDQQMLEMKKSVLKMAQSKAPALIYGETGTGKEIVVQALHAASLRRNKPFIAQNCAALPANLLESLLFGTKKGSFTGSVDRKGLFELADGGTLFLDELNSMPIDLQAKLLRVLQEERIRPIGGNTSIPVDVRIVVAMNEDPWQSVEAGRLRSDLFYRIHVMSLYLTPLCERKGDIALLTNHFIQKYSDKRRQTEIQVAPEVMKKLSKYHWPGNVRELEHAIEAAVHMLDGDTLKEQHFPPGLRKHWATDHNQMIDIRAQRQQVRSDEQPLPSLTAHIEAEEKYWIQKALERTSGNIKQAAQQLQIPRQTLQYKMKKYHIE